MNPSILLSRFTLSYQLESRGGYSLIWPFYVSVAPEGMVSAILVIIGYRFGHALTSLSMTPSTKALHKGKSQSLAFTRGRDLGGGLHAHS